MYLVRADTLYRSTKAPYLRPGETRRDVERVKVRVEQIVNRPAEVPDHILLVSLAFPGSSGS